MNGSTDSLKVSLFISYEKIIIETDINKNYHLET